MLISTDVLIWYMRGNKKALKLIENQVGFVMSVVTYLEILQGMRNKKEMNEFRKAIKQWNSHITQINEETSTKAMFFMEKHYLSHSLQLSEALIAATAIANGLTLLTANDKHYRIIKELKIIKFRP